MQTFGQAMRGYIRGGLTPASAMRSTWADVRRGSVSRPQRGARKNPKVRRLKHRGRVYDVLGHDPGLESAYSTTPRGGYLVRAPHEKAVQIARVSPGRVEYVTPIAPSVRSLRPSYKAAIRRYRGNPRPTLGRVGELVARIVAQTGGNLDAVADAHARVYGYPRGDVYEMARRWLSRHELRNPAPRYFKRPGGVRLDVIGRDPRAPGVFLATRDDAPEGMVYAVRSRAGQVRSVSPVTRSRRTLLPIYQRGARYTRPATRNPDMGMCQECGSRTAGVFPGPEHLPGCRRYQAPPRRRSFTIGRRPPGLPRRTPRRRPPPPQSNPRAVLIYDRVLKIFASKGRGPHRGQRFVHNFRTGARMLGLPNGDLLITGR